MPANTDKARYWFPKPYADFVQRLRVVGGFVLLAAFAWFSRPDWPSVAVGVPVSLCGLSLRAWASGHLAKNQQLATSGPYALLRNPLYAGTLVAAIGIVIASRSVTLALIFAGVFLLVYLPAVELEEQHLRNLFPDYEAYARRVNRFLPRVNPSPGGGTFSSALYFRNQEYKALLGYLLALCWLIWNCSRSDG